MKQIIVLKCETDDQLKIILNTALFHRVKYATGNLDDFQELIDDDAPSTFFAMDIIDLLKDER